MLVLSLSPISFSYPAQRIILPCFSDDVMSGVQVATGITLFCVCVCVCVCIVTVNYWFTHIHMGFVY